MKKKIMIVVVILLLLGTSYPVFTYYSQKAITKEANKTALKIDQIPEEVISEDFSQYFAGNKGSFVLFDKNKNIYFIYDEVQSQQRVSPCSTFKIINSLIGLEAQILQDENTVLKWNGKRNEIDAWNRDHTLASAFSNSVVWYYQAVASKVGREKMESLLKEADYGNIDISGGLTKFWLNSSLKISPLEQVVLLRKFYSYGLPFSRKNIDIVKNIMIISANNVRFLSGKTGFAGSGLGWFVGYVEKDNNVYFFATKLEGSNITPSTARKITETILKDKELL